MQRCIALILSLILIFAVAGTVGVFAGGPGDDKLFEGYTCTCGCTAPLVDCECPIAEELKAKIRSQENG